MKHICAELNQPKYLADSRNYLLLTGAKRKRFDVIKAFRISYFAIKLNYCITIRAVDSNDIFISFGQL